MARKRGVFAAHLVTALVGLVLLGLMFAMHHGQDVVLAPHSGKLLICIFYAGGADRIAFGKITWVRRGA